MWVELRRWGDDSALNPIGFEFRVNVTALSPSQWTVDYVWFRNLTFSSFEQLRHDFDKNSTVKQRLKQYEQQLCSLFSESAQLSGYMCTLKLFQICP